MKNLFKNLMLVAVAAMAFTSCNNEDFNELINGGIEQDNTVTMTFVADAPESRTSVAIEGNTAKYSWSEGDVVGFYYVDANATDSKKKKKSNAASISGSVATFTAPFETIQGATAYNIGAFYPENSWGGHVDSNPFNNVKVEIPFAQTLTEGTFDPNADLMMSKPFMGVTLDSKNAMTLEFTRIAAIGKMNLNLADIEDGEKIERVKLAFAKGTHFTGPVSLNFENSTYALAETGTSNSVELSGELVADVAGTSIYFTCFPGEYSGEYTIEVKTDKATYTKSANITKALVFTAGDVLNINATLNVRVPDVIQANEVVDVLTRETTGITKNNTSYSNWSDKTATSAAVYAGNSAGGNDAIQLRSNNNNSGIVTTASGGNARKVVVTWNSNTASGRTLNVYGKDSAYTDATDLYNTSNAGTLIGTIVCGTSTELEIDGDYAYVGLRSKSGAMYVSEIEITWETSTPGDEEPETPEGPVQLATPGVKATVDVNVVNLSWEAVEGVAYYTVQVDDDIEEKVEETTYSFVGDYETEYMFTVKAIAADTTKNIDSEAVVVTVTTGEQPSDTPVETVLTIAEFLALTDVVPSDATAEVIAAAPLYTLNGTITSVTNTSYGNFYLNDGTGEVLIYGLVGPNGETKYWANSGAKVGDDITVKTIRTEYGNAPQGKNATFVEVKTPGTLAFWSFEATAASFIAAGGEKTIELNIYNSTSDVVISSDNAQFSATYANGVLTIEALENTNTEAVEGNITVTCGTLSQVIAVTQAAASASGDEKTEVTTELKFILDNRKSWNANQQTWEVEGVKLVNDKGSSTSNVADYTNPARFYKSSKITVTADGLITTIVFDCNSASYATTLKSSISGATVSVSSDKVTVTLDGTSNTFVITSLTGGQVRMDSMTVTYLQ